ncbi:MAG: bah-phd domain-containing protein [Monoraphidium minutum]|nr:MAG: bah-phd domain-containing protein [Monoraphidium minutum]
MGAGDAGPPPGGSKAKSIATFNNIVISVGDSILINPDTPEGLPYIAFVKDVLDGKGEDGEAALQVVWYYRPEEAVGGRKAFHGAKELFLSDHTDACSVATVIRKCRVLTLKDYQGLAKVGDDDYFSRFSYRPASREFAPDRVPVFCRCELPYNPDRFMAMCDSCEEWFHPECIGASKKDMQSEDWRCPDCRR